MQKDVRASSSTCICQFRSECKPLFMLQPFLFACRMAAAASASTPASGGGKKGFVAAQSIEPLQNHTSRMRWVLNIITRHGADYEFSLPSRQWMQQRLATVDVTSRRDRQVRGLFSSCALCKGVNDLRRTFLFGVPATSTPLTSSHTR